MSKNSELNLPHLRTVSSVLLEELHCSTGERVHGTGNLAAPCEERSLATCVTACIYFSSSSWQKHDDPP